MAGLKNDFMLRVDRYPKILSNSYDALIHFETHVNKPAHGGRGELVENSISYHMEEGNTAWRGQGGVGGHGNNTGQGTRGGHGQGTGTGTGWSDNTELTMHSTCSYTANNSSCTISSNDTSSAPAPYLAVPHTAL